MLPFSLTQKLQANRDMSTGTRTSLTGKARSALLSGTVGPGARYALSRRLLSRAYGPFMGPILKGRKGSMAVDRDRLKRAESGPPSGGQGRLGIRHEAEVPQRKRKAALAQGRCSETRRFANGPAGAWHYNHPEGLVAGRRRPVMGPETFGSGCWFARGGVTVRRFEGRQRMCNAGTRQRAGSTQRHHGACRILHFRLRPATQARQT